MIKLRQISGIYKKLSSPIFKRKGEDA